MASEASPPPGSQEQPRRWRDETELHSPLGMMSIDTHKVMEVAGSGATQAAAAAAGAAAAGAAGAAATAATAASKAAGSVTAAPSADERCLCIIVREARNLVAKDYETASSDP
jgi:hypothetical protein